MGKEREGRHEKEEGMGEIGIKNNREMKEIYIWGGINRDHRMGERETDIE